MPCSFEPLVGKKWVPEADVPKVPQPRPGVELMHVKQCCCDRAMYVMLGILIAWTPGDAKPRPPLPGTFRPPLGKSFPNPTPALQRQEVYTCVAMQLRANRADNAA